MCREKEPYKIEVHVAGIIFQETAKDLEVLIVKRNNQRELYPGKWECGGGQVHLGENFEEAVKRQMKEELGANVKKSMIFGTYEILIPKSEQKKIPGVRFVCFLDKKEPFFKKDGPRIDEAEHEGWRWQSINDLNRIDFISGIREEIRQAWEFYSNNKYILS